jgi:hypothetical protein
VNCQWLVIYLLERNLLVRKIHLLSVGFQELVLQHSVKVGGPRKDILMGSKKTPLMAHNDGGDGACDGAICKKGKSLFLCIM